MGLSETIMAAMIGAIATVTAALFQLFTAWRSRSKVDNKPRRGLTARSILAVLALMTASAAGGFLYSELMKERTDQDMRAMRQELKELRSLIAQTREQSSSPIGVDTADSVTVPTAPSTSATTSTAAAADVVESIVYVPACRRSEVAGSCGESDSQRIALCGTIPSYARVEGIELFAQPDAVQHPWESHRIAFEQDVGGARFTGKSFEYAQAQDLKAVCVNFMHWSSEHPHIARILVRYGFGGKPFSPAPDPVTPAQPDSSVAPTIVSIGSPAVPTPAGLVTPVTMQ